MPSSVASASPIIGGIFTSEPGQRLLTILELFTRQGFESLYDRCRSNLAGTYYQTGLRRVHLWTDATIEEDVAYVRGRCADLDETYEACFVDYIRERYRGNQRPTVRCPPLVSFVRHFLESVAQQDALTTGDFFAIRDPVMRRMACMEAGRSALYALVSNESLRVELASQVSAARSAPRSLADASPADLEQRSVVSRTAVPVEHAASQTGPLVRPEDSISQVGSTVSRRAPPPPPEPPAEEQARIADFEVLDPPVVSRAETVVSHRAERVRTAVAPRLCRAGGTR